MKNWHFEFLVRENDATMNLAILRDVRGRERTASSQKIGEVNVVSLRLPNVSESEVVTAFERVVSGEAVGIEFGNGGVNVNVSANVIVIVKTKVSLEAQIYSDRTLDRRSILTESIPTLLLQKR